MWFNSPATDFTLKVYSPFQGVNILDSNNITKIINYDGSSPSGFTNSNYAGMSSNCSGFPYKNSHIVL